MKQQGFTPKQSALTKTTQCPFPRKFNRKTLLRGRFTPARCASDEMEVETCDISDEQCFSLSLRLQQLRLHLEAAVDGEEFEKAATLLSSVQNVELAKRSLTVSQNISKANVLCAVGTCIRHRSYFYRGVIVGYDEECLAPQTWQDSMRVHLLTLGRKQPFYHVLVDVRDRPGGQTTYVAQENIVSCRRPHHIEHPLVDRYLQILKSHDEKEWWYMPKVELRELYQDDF